MSDLLRGVTELIESGESGRVVSAVRRWRSRHGEALLVVDQFEELFTLSPKETRERFAALLLPARLRGGRPRRPVAARRLPDPLLGARAARARLRVADPAVRALTTDGLRRALVEPAKKRGYSFEDEALVEEMVESVEGARGALPLLAFAVSRLWERRDRERKVLTRATYEEIGGVAGALAQHAEATLDRVGAERQDGRARDLPQPRDGAGDAGGGSIATSCSPPSRTRGPPTEALRGADRRAAGDEATRWRARRASRATTGSKWCTSRC